MKAVSTTLPRGFAPRYTYHATRSKRTPPPTAARCSRQDIWERNLALQQTRQADIARLQREITARNGLDPSPATAILHSQLRAAERSQQAAVLKIALLQAEAAGYGQAPLLDIVRTRAASAVGGLALLGHAQPVDIAHLWGRWALVHASAPGAFKPVAPHVFGATCDASLQVGVAGVTRLLRASGSYCDTLVLGDHLFPPKGAVMVTGAVQATEQGGLRLQPQWFSCALTNANSTDVCKWPAYGLPLRFLDEDMMLLGDPRANDSCVQAWVRCD